MSVTVGEIEELARHFRGEGGAIRETILSSRNDLKLVFPRGDRTAVRS